MVETLKRLLQLHIRAVLVSLDHVVDLMQPLLQLLRDPGQGVAGVHPPPVVGLEGSDIQAGLGRGHDKDRQAFIGRTLGGPWGLQSVTDGLIRDP